LDFNFLAPSTYDPAKGIILLRSNMLREEIIDEPVEISGCSVRMVRRVFLPDQERETGKIDFVVTQSNPDGTVGSLLPHQWPKEVTDWVHANLLKRT
jgi:hypothetical protein